VNTTSEADSDHGPSANHVSHIWIINNPSFSQPFSVHDIYIYIFIYNYIYIFIYNYIYIFICGCLGRLPNHGTTRQNHSRMQVAVISFNPIHSIHAQPFQKLMQFETRTNGSNPFIYICQHFFLSLESPSKIETTRPGACLTGKPTMQTNRKPRNSVKQK